MLTDLLRPAFGRVTSAVAGLVAAAWFTLGVYCFRAGVALELAAGRCEDV